MALRADWGAYEAREIEVQARTSAVLISSAAVSEADVLAALPVGVGCVDGVRILAAGGCYLSAELADVLLTRTEDDVRGPHSAGQRLAPREQEVLSLVALGLTQRQVATRLGVSATTVDTYMKRIRHKLGPGNKADLTRRALELGEAALLQAGRSGPGWQSREYGPDAPGRVPHIKECRLASRLSLSLRLSGGRG